MRETKIPGIKALHKFVTKNCRKRPNMEWLEDIHTAIDNQLIHLNESWDDDSDVKFHVVVTVEFPEKG